MCTFPGQCTHTIYFHRHLWKQVLFPCWEKLTGMGWGFLSFTQGLHVSKWQDRGQIQVTCALFPFGCPFGNNHLRLFPEGVDCHIGDLGPGFLGCHCTFISNEPFCFTESHTLSLDPKHCQTAGNLPGIMEARCLEARVSTQAVRPLSLELRTHIDTISSDSLGQPHPPYFLS